jgi:hypothetical protein
VDPDSLNPDPDPAFQVNPDPIRFQGFDDQKLKKKKKLKTFKNLSLFRNLNLLMSKLQEKPSSLQREHPALH